MQTLALRRYHIAAAIDRGNHRLAIAMLRDYPRHTLRALGAER